MAYAVLVSLFNTTHKILNPYPLIIPCNKQTIHSLHENIHSLMSFFENIPPHKYQTTKSLEANIIDVGYKAEDILESYISKHSRSIYKFNKGKFVGIEGDDETDENDENAIMLSRSLMEVVKGFEFLMEEMKEIQSYVQMTSLSVAGSSSLASPSDNTSSAKTKFVLVDKDMMNQIKEQLFYGEKQLKVIPIVGMGGIGKTTLAKALIDDPFTSRHFNVRGWITVSQQYNIQDVVDKLLKDIIGEDQNNETLTESKVQLHQTLYERRYIVVLDDLWDTEACNELLRLFPDWNNGSRIVVTTRRSRVATFASESYHEMKLLNGDMSWDLLRQVVFGAKEVPSELVETGKEIARKCSGLPLAISVIGGLLSNEKIMTVQHWEQVAQNMKSALTGEGDDQCLEILTLSYNHLPHHLKACFIYMGIFPEDYTIPVSELLRLWVAEGFLKTSSTNIEKLAEVNLMDLIERNLILVEKLGYDGKPNSLKVHDLLRDLCIKEAEKEKFLYVLKEHMDFSAEEARGHRRLSILRSCTKHEFDVTQSMPGIRSFIVFQYTHTFGSCELLRVIHMPAANKNDFKGELIEQGNLRYVTTKNASWMIFKMWDLQYLFVSHKKIFHIPQCIWYMPQLRHVANNSSTYLPRLPRKTESPIVVLEKLEVLSLIQEFRCDDEILVRIPNLRSLKLYYDDGKGKASDDWSYYRLDNLVKMTKLETLSCTFRYISTETLLPNLGFPLSLKKLCLEGCEIPWKHMDIIGVLPNLEILEIGHEAFVGKTWETSENHFEKLEYLVIDSCYDLKEWIVEDANHFPSLRYLRITCCSLRDIPTNIGEIPTLEMIELIGCRKGVVSSAVDVQDGINNDLKLVINFNTRHAYDVDYEQDSTEESEEDEDKDAEDGDEDKDDEESEEEEQQIVRRRGRGT